MEEPQKYKDYYIGYIMHDTTIAKELAKIGYTLKLSDCKTKVIFASIMQRLQTLQKNIENHYTKN